MALFKKQEEEQYAERVRSLNKLTHEGPALRRMAGKIKLKGEDSSSEEEGQHHHFDFIHDIEQLVEVNPNLPQQTEIVDHERGDKEKHRDAL